MSEEETSPDSQTEPVIQMRAPRLSILHLMLWTLCSAVYLALVRVIYALQDGLPDGYATIQQSWSVIHCIVAGAVFTGAIALVSTRVRCGPPLLREPGQWLLFISAMMALIRMPLLVAMILLQDETDTANRIISVYGFVFLMPTIAFFYAARRDRDRSWKLLFYALVIVSFSQVLMYLAIGSQMGFFSGWFQIVNAIVYYGKMLLSGAIVVVSIVELKNGRQRDWLHWTGVISHVAESGLSILRLVASWFVV